MIDTNEARYDQHAARYQAQADGAYQHHGMRAPPRVVGESIDDYRRRLLAPLVRYSKRWASAKVEAFGETVLPVVEDQIYADAVAAVTASSDGPLREVVTQDPSGRNIHRFYGNPEFTWQPFKQATRIVTGWRTK